MNINRLSINSWPFAVKFGVPSLLGLFLVVLIGLMSNGAIGTLQGSLQDVVERKYNASLLLAKSAELLRAANGDLYRMQVGQAAGVAQDITASAKKIGDDLDSIVAMLSRFRADYAAEEDVAKIEGAIANVKKYKDAVSFVASMLDVDFKATVNFLAPMAESYDGMIADIDGIASKFLDQSTSKSQEAVKTAATRKMMLFVVGGLVLLAIAAVTIVIVLLTSRSVTRVAAATRRLADGDIGIDVAGLARSDELGLIVEALATFRTNIERVRSLEEEQKTHEQQAVAERKRELHRMADDFEATIGQIVGTVASASTELHANAENLSQFAEQTNGQSRAVASATDEASASVHTVAAAAEELAASINEITRQVEESTRITTVAVDQVHQTDSTVSTLSEAAKEIGDVVNLIRNIAHQTNLLALNATIEAARAGDAGKGFAVVASEVKNLANQTAHATEGITQKIDTIQAVSAEAVEAIRKIGATISQTNDITGTIAHAIHQQANATGEISRNVQQTSASTNLVTGSISSVTQAANDSLTAASQVLDASGELSRQAERLRSEIGGFLSRVRAG